MTVADMKQLVIQCVTMQLENVVRWHDKEPGEACGCAHDEISPGTLLHLAEEEHKANFRLWHVEDEARRRDVGDDVIAQCKRDIDKLNQRRNDLIEKMDQCLTAMVETFVPESAPQAYNTETIGSAMDRLSIICLKIFHMDEQMKRAEAGPEHVEACGRKLAVLAQQHKDLVASVLGLLDEYAAGVKRPKVYYQFKMYNDPQLNPALHKMPK